MMTRLLIRSFITLSLALLSASTVLAAVPPLLEARGKQQQCDSLEVWTRKAQELGGEDVIGGNIMSDLFWVRIAPAFGDSVFVPLIGKPYRDLSDREKKKIYDIVDRCLTKAGTRGFLPAPFDTSSRANTAAHQRYTAALKNVSEDLVTRTQNAADARAQRESEFKEGRPVRIARSIPADPKAIKRRKLTNRMCYFDTTGWRFLYNDYVFDGDAVVASTDERQDGRRDQGCREPTAMQRFVPDVTSLLRTRFRSGALLAVGDICGKDPEILFLYGELNTELPKYNEFPRNAARRGMGRPHFRSLPYQFYVPSGHDGLLHDRIINRVESGLLVTREIVMEQCKTVPESIRVTAGTTRQDVGPQPFDRMRGQNVPENLDYWEFYSGTFFPKEPAKRLVHDDQKLATTYLEFASGFGEYVLARREEQSNRGDGSTALGFLALALLGVYLADPCNDNRIPYTDRLDAGCFDPPLVW